MKTISFIIPSRSNLPYLKQAYNSIRKHLGYIHEICMADDASDDNTWEWMQEIAKKDAGVKIHRNKGPERLGHTILYDTLINDYASNEIFAIFHADMIATPNFVDNMIKHLEKGKVVSSTRIEPPLHPPGPEKIIQNFGLGTDEYDDGKFQRFVEEQEKENKDKTSSGIFAPWMMYKEDFQRIGGHDPLFAPMELEDSDIFNRMYLNGLELIQSRDSYCYHMTCRGSRFKDGLEIEKEIPLPDGTIWYKPKDSEEYKKLRENKFREWWRKWGCNVLHDENLLPTVPPKYDIGFVVKMHGNTESLSLLEPWCSKLYVDCDYVDYIKKEQPNTLYDLHDRIYSIHAEKTNDIIVRFDLADLTNESYKIIQNLSSILKESGGVGVFELDIFEFIVKKLNNTNTKHIHIQDDNRVVQSMWIGDKLSTMEQLAIKSFLDNGHKFHLYTYGEVKGIPKGTIVKDGNEILPESEIFYYTADPVHKGSVSSFSNWFRYKLLFDKGGWWVDTDNICLKPFNFSSEYVFSSEWEN